MKYHKPTLANEFAWATECNLATLDELISLKTSSGSRVSRQRSICQQMMQTVGQHEAEIDWSNGPRSFFGRVEELLKAIKAEGVAKAFEAYIDRLCRIYNRTLPKTQS